MYLRRMNVAKLVRLRRKRGWNMTDLAEQSGVSYSMIKYIHWGEKEPSDVIAERIAQALEVEVEDFSDPIDEQAAS